MYNRLLDSLPPDRIRINELMNKHTTFKIGGPVDVMVLPRDREEITRVVTVCREDNLAFFVLGLGSNILVRDKGFRGVVIKLGNSLKNVQILGEEIYAEAGIRLSELSRRAASHSLSGLEFAEGIPGSLGGAVVMNAGAYDGEMKDVLISVEAITPLGQIELFNNEEMGLAYRKSIFQHNGYIVVSARMKLKSGNMENIQGKMRELAHKRREKQPVEYPSAGSAFRRPDGFYVGPMIEKLGLKGYQMGGAQVSTKHAGFIVNAGNATAHDVLQLIKYIQNQALDQFGVDLQPEIMVIGEE